MTQRLVTYSLPIIPLNQGENFISQESCLTKKHAEMQFSEEVKLSKI